VKRSLTVQVLIGLVTGLVIGIVLTRVAPDAVPGGLSLADGAVRLWTNALRLMVVPLVVSQLFVAITEFQASKGEAARLGVSIPSVFLFLLLFIGITSVLLTLGVMRLPILEGLTLPPGATDPALAASAASQVAGPGSWIDDVVPPNLVIAVSRPEAILGLILFAVAFARAARRISEPLEQSLKTLALAVRDTLFTLIGWLLLIVPVLLVALGFRFAVNSGLTVGRLLVSYVLIESIATLTATALLYPVSVLGGRVSLRRFARAAAPAQVAAVTTRSSLATVPVLLKEAEGELGIPSRIAGLVIPFGAATLKLSRMVSSPVKFVFLAHVLGLPISIEQIAIFSITIIMMSPMTLGVPSVISGSRSLPAYVAAGIPPEYVVLLGATTWIVDVFLTVLNSTSYLTATVIVARILAGRPMRASEPVLAKDPGAPAA